MLKTRDTVHEREPRNGPTGRRLQLLPTHSTGRVRRSRVWGGVLLGAHPTRWIKPPAHTSDSLGLQGSPPNSLPPWSWHSSTRGANSPTRKCCEQPWAQRGGPGRWQRGPWARIRPSGHQRVPLQLPAHGASRTTPEGCTLGPGHSCGSRTLSGTIAPHRWVNPKHLRPLSLPTKCLCGSDSQEATARILWSLRPMICRLQRRVPLPGEPGSHVLSHAGPSEDSRVGCAL